MSKPKRNWLVEGAILIVVAISTVAISEVVDALTPISEDALSPASVGVGILVGMISIDMYRARQRRRNRRHE